MYIVMHKNMFSETLAYPYSTLDKAIHYAKQIVDKYGDDEYDPEEDMSIMSETELKDAGWLFHAQSSEEGYCVYVIQREIDSTVSA